MKFCFATLGCKVNQFETQALAQLAQARGHTLAQSGADVCILNTCTVTSSGDHKTLRALHKMQRDNPDAVVALCGCFAQTEPERAAQLDGVDIVCGTADRAAVLTLCEQAVQNRKKICTVSDIRQKRTFEALPAGVLPGHTRALLKIQDGCDNYCTYCIIPYARGHVRSLPLAQAVEQAQRLAQNGVREIVVTGIEIASYGRDLPDQPDLTALTAALCRTVPQVRIRLGSLEPRMVTQEFCDTLCGFPNLALHFHLSLQSGCDATLKRMHRRYTTAQYLACVENLRKAFPSSSITTDVITGFPGETEQEFAQTKQFLCRCGFAAVHVFPYSERAGTPAASMPDSVPQTVRAQRADELRTLAFGLTSDFLRDFVGKTVPAVLEHARADCQPAHSRWHFAIELPLGCGNQGDEIDVVLTEVCGNSMRAIPAKKD
ncbi:tRNA (N(6)-L-threonylcarbamoyladenosine(37)-C(2))-methylthiotransferase MtaB [Butyricicoccus porcorum]|nr:tRNA (N(6)-L-threonylcarbamoyladenosine(37)-C(2))-methylthiotransferase MtaB [Butyricicoccus porcorum]MDY4484317.1 tRNA (N(6)-L-threonylcarbamoyladenosine(37)-C(2))-methylthiotransferase MtaB [Butyricicoccus porcorum]